MSIATITLELWLSILLRDTLTLRGLRVGSYFLRGI